MIADEANTYTQTPEIDGEASGIKYKLFNWRYLTIFDKFSVDGTNPPSFKVSWGTFDFKVSFTKAETKIEVVIQYHICTKVIPICENGSIEGR